MNILFVIRQRMEELSLDQKDLAAAADVTESYISQLLTRKKAPPAPERTDIYSKLEKFLKLPDGRLSELAELQRREELQRKLMNLPAPLFKDAREVILRKCVPDKTEQLRTIFEKQPFGDLERLVTLKLLDVVQGLATEELSSESWLHSIARLGQRSYADARVSILEFLDTDVFHISKEHCVFFLDPLTESWDIDFASFGVEFTLNCRRLGGTRRRFEFVEQRIEQTLEAEPAFEEFLNDTSLSCNVTEKEIDFLKGLRFNNRARPTAMYFYRELQSLRDPLHFRTSSGETDSRPERAAKRRREKFSR